MRSNRIAAAFLLLAVLVNGASAQDSVFTVSPASYSNWAALGPMRERLEKSHQTIFGQSVQESLDAAAGSATSPARTPAPAGSRPERSATRFEPQAVASGQRVARLMAQPYPEASRAQVERVFDQLLAGFRKVESQLGLPGNDVATAVAAFIIGNYAVYRNTAVPDEHFVALAGQMRRVVGNTPAFAQASPASKQETYEQLAILGMLMATTQMALDREPNAKASADAKAAAAGYLRAFLATGPERLQLTASGMRLQ